ncbi:Rho guanyl nucleotide exchange factor (Rom2), putative [Talaromyces stipitatus ATCC 10500]|uniref:Rho guanyl nucleotide exchange factor (Rom2), putative n=1 Tax=Talaromyces stipitatus (strain ATCC 10500 / CBS 375.48 / QM 6759 / NRRL 1006) TaxID=441959 RepID=B8MD88_TALSN|nr:Rho guanyl nucleotide exchange factor (Rom2), putative [Talaromyces stipitatus ATCC 10500]EED17613.1 Rho guanyl nucleotide exchange factor (Rom2), putative [Talaromyces stipitatus ATCC 10500]
MADLGHDRNYRPNTYGQAPNPTRDAAFSDIFGSPAHAAGRSQTMTSQTAPFPNERSRTMTSHIPPPSMHMQQRGPPHPGAGMRHLSNGYGSQQIPNGNVAQQPHQNYPRPFPRGSPYPGPVRVGSGPNPHYPNPNFPIPQGRPGFSPALNSYPDRTRSMANLPMRPPPQQTYSQPPVTRDNHYNSIARTPQGRPVPEKHEDPRTMSLSSYSSSRDHAQTAYGRPVPTRPSRPPSGPDHIPSQLLPAGPQVQSQTQTQAQGQAFPEQQGQSDGNYHHLRRPSDASMTVRTMSMASTLISDRTMSLQSQPMQKQTTQSTNTTAVAPPRKLKPLVYPALLSRVADVFRERMPLGEYQKNGLSYQNAFSGSKAVDLIAHIIRTPDRNLALLLGRALDAQKFFHDVTYDHRLRDSAVEIYQFKETVTEDSPTSDVNGVFTLLTECYSPTCTRDNLCYSIACPRRLEQQARLNLKPQPGLRHSSSKSSLHADDDNDNQKLWINMVPKEVSDTLEDREKKRQEIIFEIMYTERDFVKDLEYLRDFWMRPLRSAGNTSLSPIPEHRREKFIRTVFGNCLEVLKVNSALCEALNARQKENHVVHTVGDIFLQHVPRFDPFIKYGANQLYGKYEFEKEKASNPAFARFVEETERLKESRKLELNGYLTKPTTRLARYPLLLEQVAKNTADDNPDKQDIPKAIGLIKDFLSRVNTESGKAENHFNLVQLNAALKFNPGDYVDLKLTEENRQMLTKMGFKKGPTDSSEVTAYLFDHAVLLVRIKLINKREEYRVYKKPIPLELLVIAQMDEVIPRLGLAKRSSSSLIPGKVIPNNAPIPKEGLPITFRHLGKGGYDLTLYATSPTQRKKFIEMVEEQQRKLRERNSNFYSKTILCENFFTTANRVNCLVPIDGGRKLVIGTDDGIYLAERWPKDKNAKPRRILDATAVTQIDTLEEYQLVLVLANKTLSSYPMEALDVNEGQNPLARRPKKIQGHANFFKVGIGLGRHLVCSVKTSALSTTIKVFEPMENLARGGRKPALGKMFRGGQEALKPFKEYYIPAESSSVHFLRKTLCVGCARGFEVVSLETTESQSLLDQADTSLDFVARKENVKPIHVERMNGEFLLNYSDFSFFVNRNGWRARPDWLISWEGTPNAFALSYPYILAFEPNFIEIRHIETSELIHIMTGKNIRMLHSSTREILYAYEDEEGEDVVASLDFWSKATVK